MTDSFFQFGLFREGLWIWGLFVIATSAAFLFLAQRQFVALGAELFRAFLSVFVAPFIYLRKTILELCLGDENPRLSGVDHFLLRSVLVMAQATVVLAVVIGTGVACTTAVVRFLPPLELREAENSALAEISTTEMTLAADSAHLAKEDDDWSTHRGQLIQQGRENEQAAKRDAQAAVQADESRITSAEGQQVLNTLRVFMAERGNGDGAVDQAKTFIGRVVVNEAEAHALTAFCDDWRKIASLSSTGAKSPEQIRSQAQPDHDNLVAAVASGKEKSNSLTTSLAELRQQISQSYRPGQIVITLLAFFLVFLVFVWTAGTAIEVFSMSLFLTSDVKQIRARSDQRSIYQ